MLDLEKVLDDIIKREGGFVDNPADNGGPTKYGVTLRTLAGWRVQAVSIQDVKDLTTAEAKDIYRHKYYYKMAVDKLPVALQPIMLDMLVLHRPETAWKIAQTAVNLMHPHEDVLAVDGIGGEKTRMALEAAFMQEPTYLMRLIVLTRQAFCLNRCAENPSQRVFLKGWLNRARASSAPKTRHSSK